MKKALSYKLEQFILKYVWVGVLKGAVTWCTCANFFLYAINSCAYLNKIISANTIISRKKTNRCTSSGNLWVNSLLYMTRYSNYSVCTNTKKFVMMKIYICIIPCSVDPGCTRRVYVVMKKLNFCSGWSILIGMKSFVTHPSDFFTLFFSFSDNGN